jgi:cell division septation protein DedD/tetratricopeptide (TPR) repeat protein
MKSTVFGNNSSVRPTVRLRGKAAALLALFWPLCAFILLAGHASSALGQETFYAVQTGSFKNFQNAARALAHFQKKGFHAFCRYQAVEGQGKWFRIYVGRFETERQAQQTAQRLMDEAGDAGVLVKKVKEPANPYYLHVGSYAMKAQAEQEIRQRVKYLLEPFFKEVYVSGQRWFRLYVGPFANAQDAVEAGREMKEQGMISYFRPVRMKKGQTVSQRGVWDLERKATSVASTKAEDQAGRGDTPDQGAAVGGEPTAGIAATQEGNGSAIVEEGGDSGEKGKGPPLDRNEEVTATADTSRIRETIKQAEIFMAQGNADEAYGLLAPLEAELAGNMDYDYLLAIAALDSGNPAKASLVFERILTLRPEFAGARLDMARAYYALGNHDQAKTEFEAVLNLNPPPQAKAVTKQYLAAIEKAAEAKATTISGYVEATFGYDDNVNNSTDQNEIYVPAFAVNMALAPTNVQAEDTYGALAGGVSVQHHVKRQLLSYLDVDGTLRRNREENAFDLDGLVFRGGLRLVKTCDSFRVGLRAERSWLNGDSYRDTVGVEGDWRHLVNPRNQLVLFGQYNQNRYEQYDINDVDQLIGGVSWLHALAAPYKPIIFSSAYLGNEADRKNRADGGKVFFGMRIGGQIELNERACLFANLGGLYSDYDATNVSFMETRDDRQFDARLGLNWWFKTDWTLKPQIAYTENKSNIDLYEYDRIDVSLTVRYDFN